MPSQQLSLEELGLLQLLEKLSEDAPASLDRFARFGLQQRGLISESDPPALTELGAARLDQLRRAKEGKGGAPQAASEPDPSPA